MTTLFHFAERILNAPLLLAPEKADILLHVLEGRIGIKLDSTIDLEAPELSRFVGSATTARGERRMSAVEGGVAIIPVLGTLVNRGAWIGARSGLTSYEGLDAQIREAAAASDVKAILLDIDSPGGEALGAFNLAQTILEARGQKPVVAVVNDMAASAAYAIASAASSIIVSPTSMVGSIGVVMAHMDKSEATAKEGVRPTLIYAGRHKVDGNPYAPLSDGARAEYQGRVNQFYEQFVAQVEAGRGARFTADMARGTEARIFMGDEAVQIGMADRVATFSQVLSELQTTPRAGQSKKKGIAMSNENGSPAAVNAGISETERAAIRAEGATAERERIAGILNSEAAVGREQQAIKLALEPGVSVEGAKAILASIPAKAAPSIEQRAANVNGFDADAAPEKKSPEVIKSAWDTAFAKTAAR